MKLLKPIINIFKYNAVIKSPKINQSDTITQESIHSSEINNQIEKKDFNIGLDYSKCDDIFASISNRAKCTALPNIITEDSHKITLFLPLDDFLVYTMMPDSNLGLENKPNIEYDLKLDLPEYNSFAFVYIRPDLNQFIEFILDKFEVILYTTGEKGYIDKVVNTLFEEKVFKHILYQNDCHLYKNYTEDVVEYLRDINQFTNRSLKRKVIIDFDGLNSLIQPDNTIIVDPFKPDEKSDFKYITNILNKILNEKEDVREFLKQEFSLREIFNDAKLI